MTHTTARPAGDLQRANPSSSQRHAVPTQPGQPSRLLGEPPHLLALDASSTTIGWVVCAGTAVHDAGTIQLTGHIIAGRCHQASCALEGVLARHPDVRLLAIEAPVARFAKALIPQARVSGALMAVAARHDLAVLEIAPRQAKQALTGCGLADKAAMQRLAAQTGWTPGTEHEADALGIAWAALARLTAPG